jgi:ABC-2 type transport system ATP-binding protein
MYLCILPDKMLLFRKIKQTLRSDMDNAVELVNLTKKFGDFVAVNNLTISIPKGKIYGFLGPNGSGKSTTIRMLTGVLLPTGGSGSVLGFDILTNGESVKPFIGYMSQKFSLYNDLTVQENLEFYAGVYGLSKAARRERSTKIVTMARLSGRENELTVNLSGGWRQRLALGCAIMHDPQVLFLDEPTSGVDPVSRRMFWDVICDLAENGTTIMVTTHFIDEAEHCDLIGIIFQANLICQGTPDEIRALLPGDLYRIDTEYPAKSIEELERQSLDNVKDMYAQGAGVHILTVKGKPLNIANVRKIEPTLEDVFVSLVQKK